MDFSDSLTGTKCSLSPDNTMIASIDKITVTIRDSESLDVLIAFPCLDSITHLVWSPDSSYIAATLSKRGLLQVFSIHDPEWHCKVDTAVTGLTHSQWTPDSRHIITYTECNLRVCVWSLIRKTVACVKSPKFNDDKGCVFSSDGEYMFLVTRAGTKDMLSIYSLSQWQLVKQITLATEDLQSMHLANKDSFVVCCDSLMDYNVYVYSVNGELLKHLNPYSFALGVKNACISPLDSFVAVGSYDNKLRLMNTLTWEVTCEFQAVPQLTTSITTATTTVYEEQYITDHTALASLAPTVFNVVNLPTNLRQLQADPQKPDPPLGLSLMGFSSHEHYVCFRCDAMPCTVWIIDLKSSTLASVVTTLEPVKQVLWDPIRLRLAIACGSDKLYLWSPEGASVIVVPLSSFNVQDIQWDGRGQTALLSDTNAFCMSFLKQ